MNTISTTSLLVRTPDLVSAGMDGETVMLDIERGEYFGIGGVGTRAWELLENPVTLGQIILTISAEYEVDQATCEEDMQGFIAKLLEFGVIRLC